MDELRQRFLAVALRFLRTREDAEDVAQETALRVLKARSNGSHLTDERAFGTRVAARLAIDRLRLRASRRIEPLPTAAEAPTPAERAAPEDVARLYAAIAALPPKQSAVVTMRKLLEMEYVDIAAVLDISEESCRSHCRLALRRLRQRLAGPEAPP